MCTSIRRLKSDYQRTISYSGDDYKVLLLRQRLPTTPTPTTLLASYDDSGVSTGTASLVFLRLQLKAIYFFLRLQLPLSLVAASSLHLGSFHEPTFDLRRPISTGHMQEPPRKSAWSYVTDLHISKNARASTNDKINLGPQTPTPVTHTLKYGSNLLQVVGQFNGKYIIVIAFMSVVLIPSTSIQYYVPLATTAPNSDNEVIEGPSRISLKCPIGFSRIKIPVKGHACKHLQIFEAPSLI